MSEFPGWVEDRLGWRGDLTYEESQDLHKALDVIRKLAPDIDKRMRIRPDPNGSLWRRYLGSGLSSDSPTGGSGPAGTPVAGRGGRGYA